MSVNHEVKGSLARLLATEDLVIEHKNVSTASFNVNTRVLVLPMWSHASDIVYDMLVGHEVGHALYTPDEDIPEDVPHQFVNLVEDARIEKLMKRRYNGLRKSFFGGYRDLYNEDFFQIKGEDISKFNLADRINLFFKIGNYIDVPFSSDKEMEIVDMVDSCETFEDVISAARVLHEYCESEENQSRIDSLDNHENSSSSDSSESSDSESSESEESNNNESSEDTSQNSTSTEGSSKNDDSLNTSENSPNPGSGSNGGSNLEVRTANNLEESIRDLISPMSEDSLYLEIPKLNLETVVVSNTEVHNYIEHWWKESKKNINEEYLDSLNLSFSYVDGKFKDFKNSAQKEVNYLVKEFECKKSADSYSRAKTSRTGILDCSKLHTYKYNEDLFKKVTVLADGKNHGLIFILDWSGSMARVMLDTIKQLYNLIWFCRKVSIPFEVYSFTNEWNYYSHEMKSHYEKKAGLMQVDDSFSLLNLFNSKVNNSTLERQMINIWRIVTQLGHFGYDCSYDNRINYTVPGKMTLSGTPLNESMIALHQIIPKFKKETKAQKVQCIVLTDGESCQLKFHKEFKRAHMVEPYIGVNIIRPHNTFLRNRKTGNNYKIPEEYYEFTDMLIKDLRESFKDVNFIGIRVIESSAAGSFIRRYTGYTPNGVYEKVFSQWKKEKSFSIKTSGYHTYFGISSNSLSGEVQFEVPEDATKTQIKSAFVKSLRKKKMNKKVLNEFVDLIS